MKYVSIFSVFLLSAVLTMAFAGGCHHAQDGDGVSNSAGASKYDRLVGNENLRLTTELENCLGEVETWKKALADCETEKEEIQKQANETASFLLQELPKDLMEENTKLTEENKNLTKRIAQFKEALRQKSQSERK